MGYVYLVHAKGTQRYKIGKTSQSPSQRINSLQTGCPYDLELIFSIQTNEADTQEDILHWFNSEHRVKGEWFEFSPDHVRRVVDRMRQELARDFVNRLSEMTHEASTEFLSGHNRAAMHGLTFLASSLAGLDSGREIDACELISDLIDLGYITEDQMDIIYEEMHARDNVDEQDISLR